MSSVNADSDYLTGWFGIPGGPATKSTPVHAVHRHSKRPVCGTRMGPNQSFQYCAMGIREAWVECRKCVASREVQKELARVRKEIERQREKSRQWRPS